MIASILGAFICCIVPLLSFGLGVYYARFGLPVSLQWRGFGKADEGEDYEPS
jgi:hypothetical protein